MRSQSNSTFRPGYPSRFRRFMQGPAALALAIGLTIATSARSVAARNDEVPAKPPSTPNILLILADDLGYGDLGCYGQKRIHTPRLDRMAGEGLRFRKFYAGATVCAPSRCVLMTGLHTGHCWIRGNARLDLRPDDVTVAELLKSAGYATALVGKWGLGAEGSAGVPTRQGFDSFFGYLDQRHAHNYYPEHLFRNEQRVKLGNVVPNADDVGAGVATKKVDYSHDLFATEALQFVEQHKDRPFFLYLALTIPHANNEAGDRGMEVPDLGEYADLDWPAPQKAHAAMISRMDRDVGRLLDKLKELGIDEKTLVLFSSDNGPHAEGGNDPNFNHSRGGLRGIKRDLYEGGIRVPTIARWPGTIEPGVSDHIGYFADVLPTLVELAGAKSPDGLDGVSFAPTLLGRHKDQAEHEYLYWEFYERRGAQAVREGKWKAVRSPVDAAVELYDLEADPAEKNDLAKDRPEVAARLTALIEKAHRPAKQWHFPGSRKPAAAK
ncbi:MAG: arylsulfatase [Pirellulales bacterium]